MQNQPVIETTLISVSTSSKWSKLQIKSKTNPSSKLTAHAHLTNHYKLDADDNAWSFALNAPDNTKMKEVYIGTTYKYQKYVCQFYCNEIVGKNEKQFENKWG